MANMKTDGLNDFDRNDLFKSIGNSFYDDVPNLGSVITLDNKGRLINSQFSKPSSSQTLLKLNSSEEVPDADDLPYSVISYGDTVNAINLPYNDHNYVGTLSNKSLENYDKKALEFTSKQTGQYTNRSTFPPPTNLRISHFSSFNTNHLSQSDFINNRPENIFFNEKPKTNNQFSYNQTINSLTPLITNKSLNNQSQPNGFVAKKQILPNAIVINSNSVNKVKSVSVIKLQRPPNLETNSLMNEPRIINIPIKKPNLTNVVTNEVMSNEINSSCDKTTDKTINLIPRCVCGYTHDDGGLIRCEICQTWQHIICMYPDNKFPILYKCEKCEPRSIDYSRAVATQTNFLIKMKLNPTEFLVNHDYHSYDNENNTENTHSKCHTPQYVIVQPELKTPFKHMHESSVHSSQNQIMFTNSKDPLLVPPGSPRTSKRKQDLISLKTVLTKPNSVVGTGAFTVNNIVIHNSSKSNSELQNSIMENQMNYNCYSNYLIPTSANSVKIDKSAFFTTINEISGKLKALFCNRIQTHTNLSIHQEQFLKLNNYTVNSNCSCKVIKYNNNQTVIKSIKELHCSEVIMEFNGFISLSEDYNKEFDYRKHYNPFVLFYEKFDHLSLAIDAISKSCDSKYIRRSCTPNAEVKHRVIPNGSIRFFITPINWISNDTEITIGFDFNYKKCSYSVECACGHPNCELKYWMIEEARRKKMVTSPLDEYDAFMYNSEHLKPIMSKPHKKRGRAAKILNTSNRQIMDRPVVMDANPPSAVVRRNKRGRPPLNRQNGIQRSDVKASSDSSSNNCLTEFKEISDNESVPCRTNENIHPSLALRSNFKNFKRISSSHWSLKAHRKLCANKTKPTKSYKTIVPQKVGRPVKHKKEKVVEFKRDVDLSSEPPSSPDRYNETEKSFDNNANISSNEEYETNMLQYSHEMKHEMTREEEGKYWLEEINNKIYKQKLKEAKKIKRKSRTDKKLSRKITNFNSHKNYVENFEREQVKEIVSKESPEEYKEEIVKEEVIETHSQSVTEVVKEKNNLSVATPVKAKRGRKSFKNNKSYIVSYKTSNIDDLKNDLMLISASLKEEPEEEPNIEPEIVCHTSEKLKVETLIEPTTTIEAEGSEKNFSDSFETKKSSTEVESFIDSSDEKLLAAFKSKHRKLHSCKTKDGMKDPMKGSREERWVNIMWQRILKNENSDSKSKRKRSKSSFADESNQSEENANESNDLASPKFGDSDFCDDNLSCENKESDSNVYKLNSIYNIKRKPNKFKSSSFSDSDKLQPPEKPSHSKSNEIDNHVRVEYSNNSSMEESEKANVSSNEQCGLIVYKEQQSNPMEKFSRENSAKMFNESYSEGGNNNSSNPSVQHPPHAKKRWLSQALLEENLNEASETSKETNNTLNDAFIEKFISIDNSSKHSFLPPVITSVDNTAFSLTPPKIAMNPKKRLLNQFSMEDNAFKINSSDISSYNNKSNNNNNKWDQNGIDQEQSKTKLTLSEYRKRRYCDKTVKSESNLSLKISKKACNNKDSEWVGISDRYGSPPVKEPVEESGQIDNYNSAAYLDATKKLKVDSPINATVTEPAESNANKNSSLSYLNTLNNLKMPGNLDPRLTKSTAFLNKIYINRNQSEIEPSSMDNTNSIPVVTYSHVESCPRSPSKSPNSPGSEWRMSNFNDRGPRTPSDIDELSINPNNDNDCLSIYAPSQRSIDSFESQPSPTSDCHFDFDRSENNFECKSKSINCDSSGANDWTSHAASIARMAGIPNPDLLQEIEEFDDEYVPLPDNLPERSKEEMETLLLTQKRDSQIREWQEVKQLEREKVKLEHQVRSMQRRNQRITKPNDVAVKSTSMMKSSIKSADHQSNGDPKFSFSLMTTMTDERTMKTFNVQLSNFNDKLMEQINLVKNNNRPLKPPSQNADLPLSYRLSDDIIIPNDTKKSIPIPDDLNNLTASAVAVAAAAAITTSNPSSNPKLRKRNNEKTINPQQKMITTKPDDTASEIDQSHFSIVHSNNSSGGGGGGGGTYPICSQPAPPHAQFLGGIQKSSEVVSSIIISDHVPTFKSMTSAFM